MIKLFFLMIYLFMGSYPLMADGALGKDDEFIKELDVIKNPFEDGIPIPIPVVNPKPVNVDQKGQEKHMEIKPPQPVVVPVITLPALKLQGVIVGGDIYEAIIDDNIVALQGDIKGAKVLSVSKDGVGLSYKGKKFFLKVD